VTQQPAPTKRAPSPSAQRPGPQERNAHPWRSALLLAVGAFALILIVGMFFASTKSGPEALGMVYGESLPGFVALGIWARKSRQRWSRGGWLVRALLCMIVSVAIMALFVGLGGALDTVSR